MNIKFLVVVTPQPANYNIPCVCVLTSILDQPWVLRFPAKKQHCSQYFQYCTCWPVLGSFKNRNILQLSHKATPSE